MSTSSASQYQSMFRSPLLSVFAVFRPRMSYADATSDFAITNVATEEHLAAAERSHADHVEGSFAAKQSRDGENLSGAGNP